MKVGLGLLGGIIGMTYDWFAGRDWTLFIIAGIALLIVSVVYFIGIQTIVNIIVLIAALCFLVRWIMS